MDGAVRITQLVQAFDAAPFAYAAVAFATAAVAAAAAASITHALHRLDLEPAGQRSFQG